MLSITAGTVLDVLDEVVKRKKLLNRFFQESTSNRNKLKVAECHNELGK